MRKETGTVVHDEEHGRGNHWQAGTARLFPERNLGRGNHLLSAPFARNGYERHRRVRSEFIEKMKSVSETDLNYFGIALCGAKKKVNKLTGSMPLLR